MKKYLATIGLMIGLTSVGMAQADVGVSAGIGTTGLGLHLSTPIQAESLNARFGINAWNYSYSGSASSVDYNYKMKLQTFDALLDWFPMQGVFRLSGGVVYNGTKVTATAKPSAGSTYTFNGQTYLATDVGSATGAIDFRKAAPYLGIGFGNAVEKDKGWGMSSDIGVLFQGSAKAKITAVCGPTVATAPGGCSGLQANAATEEASLNSKMSSYKYFPVLRIAATYKF